MRLRVVAPVTLEGTLLYILKISLDRPEETLCFRGGKVYSTLEERIC